MGSYWRASQQAWSLLKTSTAVRFSVSGSMEGSRPRSSSSSAFVAAALAPDSAGGQAGRAALMENNGPSLSAVPL